MDDSSLENDDSSLETDDFLLKNAPDPALKTMLGTSFQYKTDDFCNTNDDFCIQNDAFFVGTLNLSACSPWVFTASVDLVAACFVYTCR